MKSIEQIREELFEIEEDRGYCLMDSYHPSERFEYEQELDEVRHLQRLGDDELIQCVKQKAIDGDNHKFNYRHFWNWINN